MADASRFPELALPFAIVGASAGWLSAGLLANPFVGATHGGKQILAALCAMGVAAATGAFLTRRCVGRRYSYELDAPDPDLQSTAAKRVTSTGVCGRGTSPAERSPGEP
jgi:hypothetical protein